MNEIAKWRKYCTIPCTIRITKESETRIQDVADSHDIDFNAALDLLVIYGAENPEIWKKKEKDEA